MSDLITKIGGALRWIFWWIDSIGFAFIDKAYNFMLNAMQGFNSEMVKEVTGNLIQNAYVIVGIFALFRVAVSLINSIVNPDKLTDKKEGVGNILFHFVGAIVLFIVVPLIFDLSREVQLIIIGGETETKEYQGNYIPKLITGMDLNSNRNAGEMMQLITIKSLITPNDAIGERGEVPKVDTDGNEIKDESGNKIMVDGFILDKDYDGCKECVDAVDAWNTNRVRTANISKYIASYTEVNGENEYVYNYIPFLPLIVGGFMTYVLLSFTIDIAVRSVELVVLEILSPIFIVTFVDPKMASSGPFSKWVNACTKSYLSLFIKVAIISLMLLLIANIDSLIEGVSGDSFLLKLLMIIAILIFAKKAPKWIGGMFGLDDGAGLGGLGIGKKLAGAALGGAVLAKAGRGIAGAANSTLRNLRHAARDRHDKNKKAKEKALAEKGLSTRKDRRRAINDHMTNDGSSRYSAWKKMQQDRRKALSNANTTGALEGDSLKKALSATVAGVKGGFTAGLHADKLGSALKASTKESQNWRKDTGLSGKTLGEKLSDKANQIYGKSQTLGYGNPMQRQSAADALKKQKFLEDMYGSEFIKRVKSSLPDLDYQKLINGTGSFMGNTNDKNGIFAKNLPDALQMNIANACGYTTQYDDKGNLGFYKEKKDASGNVLLVDDGKGGKTPVYEKIDDNLVKSIKNQAQMSLSDEGAAKMQALFNTKTANVINDFGKNAAAIDETQQALRSINESMNNLSTNITKGIANSLGNTKFAETLASCFNTNNPGKIEFNLDGVSGISAEDKKLLKTSITNGEDINKVYEKLAQLTTEDGVGFMATDEGEALLSSLKKLKENEVLWGDLTQLKINGDLKSSKIDEMNAYLARGQKMQLAYDWAGYKMVNDDGAIIFDESELGKLSEKVKGISSEEKLRKQQSNESRISDLEAAIKKKKEQEGKKD